jgi:hypothetical protein
VFVQINGAQRYLWRAVDQHGNVLDILVQSRRNAVAAKKFFRRLLKGLRYVPRVIVTDKLASYQVAHRELMCVGAASPVEVPEQPRRELSPADPATRAGDETLQVDPARATVPVRVQRHLRTLPAATASAQRDRMANRDGRPLRGLASGHRARRCRLKCERPNGVRSRLLQTQLRTTTLFNQRDSAIVSAAHDFSLAQSVFARFRAAAGR